jgi:hypothetical protein
VIPPFPQCSDRRARVLFAQGWNTITLGLQYVKPAGGKRYNFLAKENIVTATKSLNGRCDVKRMETWFKILNFIVEIILYFHIEIVIPVAPYVLVCSINVCHTGLVP